MGKMYDRLEDKLVKFIEEQHLYFVATATADGRINLSPKGVDTFRCIDDHTVAYLDLTGSGSETSAHLHADGRITLMFCSFTAKPLIMRLYGRGRVVRPADKEWSDWIHRFDDLPGQRQIMVITVDSAQTSCGFGVPRYDYAGERDDLIAWAERKGEDGIKKYWEDKNRVSIDGLDTGIFDK